MTKAICRKRVCDISVGHTCNKRRGRKIGTGNASFWRRLYLLFYVAHPLELIDNLYY